MKWYYWIWFIAAGSATPVPPLAFLLFCGLIGHVVFDLVPEEARRDVLSLPGRATRMIDSGSRALSRGRKAPALLQAPIPDQIGDDNGDGAAEGRTMRLEQPQAAPRKQKAAERPRWLHTLNDDPDRAPHALVVGPTGAGKTTFVNAALGQRPDATLVLSPKVNPGNWQGAEVISLDDDGGYGPIRRTLKDLEQEKRERIGVLRREGATSLEPLTIVMDETPELVRFVPEAGDFLASMSSIGRELKMRMVVLSTSTRVKDLGIEGRGAALENFVRVNLDRDRRGVLSDGISEVAISPEPVARLAAQSRLRPWRSAPEPALPALATRKIAVAAAPRTDVVSVSIPAPKVAPGDLLGSLLSSLPADVAAQVPDISPSRAERLAAVLRQQSVTVARDGGDVIVNVTQEAAPPVARATNRGRREGAVNVQDRKRRLERKAYYEQAARAGMSLQSAYDARPAGDKGDYNLAAQWYRAEKARIKAS